MVAQIQQVQAATQIQIIYEDWEGTHEASSSTTSMYTFYGIDADTSYCIVQFAYEWPERLDQDSSYDQTYSNFTIENISLYIGHRTHWNDDQLIIQLDAGDGFQTIYDTGVGPITPNQVGPSLYVIDTGGIEAHYDTPVYVKIALYSWNSGSVEVEIYTRGEDDGSNEIDVSVLTGTGFIAFDPFWTFDITDAEIGYHIPVEIEDEDSSDKDDSVQSDEVINTWMTQLGDIFSEYGIQITAAIGSILATIFITFLRYTNKFDIKKKETKRKFLDRFKA
jgi:hypothetical protein